MSKYYKFKTFKFGREDDDFLLFRNAFNRKFKHKLNEIPELNNPLHLGMILFNFYMGHDGEEMDSIKKVRKDIVEEIKIAFIPLIEDLFSDISEEDLEAPFSYPVSTYIAEEFDVMPDEESKKYSDEKLLPLFESKISKYEVLFVDEDETAQTKMTSHYERIIEDGYDSEISLRMMLNAVGQAIISKFLVEIFNDETQKISQYTPAMIDEKFNEFVDNANLQEYRFE